MNTLEVNYNTPLAWFPICMAMSKSSKFNHLKKTLYFFYTMQSFQLVGFSAYGGINLFFVETQFRFHENVFTPFYKKNSSNTCDVDIRKNPQQIQGKMLAIC